MGEYLYCSECGGDCGCDCPDDEKPAMDVNDPPYDPAQHWGEDYFIEQLEQFCQKCNGQGFYSKPTPYGDINLWCDDCEGVGKEPHDTIEKLLYFETLEEIDSELMGVGL